ncbi:natural cytotoxicity triggering receptor 3 ligand 1 isoform X1 [Ochotona princeps]|uniref:natural cytotoxicity triggering receptor 3 ligand 1 isoform X1 n=1 Tax=Ochotona princeps TaxID=9978 RepID=UPI00271490C1|nr:natural cytotoxicity triggering receptor 3 ligand 1 isoform X1 [Ochotona princeps]
MNLRENEMARRSGGLAPWRFWCLLLVLWGVLEAAGFRVEMADRTQTVFLNDNTTIICKIPGSPALDISTVGVVWSVKRKGSEEKVLLFEYYGDHKKAYRPGANISQEKLKNGDASLYLPAVQLSDAGEYFCKVVVTPEKDEKSVQLEVVATPTSKIFLDQAPENSRQCARIVCKCSGFYPDSVNITWEICLQKAAQPLPISEGIFTGPHVQNGDGTFNVTSYLTLKSPLEDAGAMYQCVVSHVSLCTTQRLNLTLSGTGKPLSGRVPYSMT